MEKIILLIEKIKNIEKMNLLLNILKVYSWEPKNSI